MLRACPNFFSKKVGLDGNTAAADIAYRMSDMSFVFPITPSSPMAETTERWMAERRENIFGNTLKLTQMQSESGAAGAIHGAAALGALTTTFTASQGLLLMLPDIYRMAGDHYPGVFHVAARSVATIGCCIYGDHSDIMCARSSGAAILASSSVQEAHDMAAIAHAASIVSSYPFIHFFDGFRTSHEINSIETIDDTALKQMVDRKALFNFKSSTITPERGGQLGCIYPIELLFQFVESHNKSNASVGPLIKQSMKKLASLTGREYKPYEYHGSADATDVIIAMGSAANCIQEYIKSKPKLGVVSIHMYRPFDVIDFLSVIPPTVQRVCVLDRTKDPLAHAEPLAVEVGDVIRSKYPNIKIIGGRYGLASKDFNPTQVAAVIDNMRSHEPKDRFSVGINDDVTHQSLSLGKTEEILPKETKQCIFWALGSDGTIGACKDAIKIITNNTPLYGQGHFEYTAHKSGGITTSYLRFGPEKINAPYLIQKADYIACHNPGFLKHIDIIRNLKEKGTVLLNIPSDVPVDEFLPGKLLRKIAEKKAKLYVIDASKIANDFGLRGRINTVMQTAFFILSGVIKEEKAIELLKNAAKHTYARKGQKVVDVNLRLIDATKPQIKQISYNRNMWISAKDKPLDQVEIDIQEKIPDTYRRLLLPMKEQKGNLIPVSAATFRGFMPPGGTQWEKRGVAQFVPVWDEAKCVQCGLCSTYCPHAVIRPFLLTKEEAEKAPYKTIPASFVKGFQFRIQISPYDCQGCFKCAVVCPAKALTMKESERLFSPMHADWNYSINLPNRANLLPPTSIKNVQFLQPLVEFSGACPGCGETAIVKMITQLYGDHAYMSFATGCPLVWGGSPPANAYTVKPDGSGPAWTNSLFEDEGEFGYGQHKALAMRREHALKVVQEIAKKNPKSECVKELVENWNKVESKEIAHTFVRGVFDGSIEVTQEEKEFVEREKNFLGYKINFIFGGDGFAYDIGYGGLDHVLASGDNVKVIILDTEVYSNTGGQPSKSSNRGSSNSFSQSGVNRAKKDLGLMAIQYGNIYVANTCLEADPKHALKTIKEAVEYDGPALIINYCPCIEHGLKQGLGQAPNHCKDLLKAGYLILSRFDPRLASQGKNPMQIDSRPPNFVVDAVIDQEVRFANLAQRMPKQAAKLRADLHSDLRNRYEKYVRIAKGYQK